MELDKIRHPYYEEKFKDWDKWRTTYEGGQRFIDRYLKRFSRRETEADFLRRKEITYVPAFSKSAVDEIKNSIFQRLVDISRVGGSELYDLAINGKLGGVDLLGSSMNSFIGRFLLPELLTMSRVGIFVDMPALSGETLIGSKNKHPYLYIYKAEDICSWCYDEEKNNNEFTHILLRDYATVYDDTTNLPNGIKTRYRRIWIEDGHVRVQYQDQGSESPEEVIDLNIDRIPFVVAELSDSLLADVANYQIALLNLASSDMAYALHSNFPFYTEQYDPKTDLNFIRNPSLASGGESSDAAAAKTSEIKVGISAGRRYPQGSERPGFIHPSSEPLEASIHKQEQLKAEIKQLVFLSAANLTPRQASAESKNLDRGSLESGLSYVGLELENVERKVAEYWAMYEKDTPTTINYPEKYTIKTDEQRRAEVDQLKELLPIVPSQFYQKSISKQIARNLLERKVSTEEWNIIDSEIDAAKGLTANPEVIAKHVEIGILNLELAAELSGYPKGTVEKAAKDHTDRLKRIQVSQSEMNTPNMDTAAARGIKDADPNPQSSGKEEKKKSTDTTEDDTVSDKTRGKNKL